MDSTRWQQCRFFVLLCHYKQWDAPRSGQSGGQPRSRYKQYIYCKKHGNNNDRYVPISKTLLFLGVPAFLVLAVTGLSSDKEASFSHATLLGAEGESLQQVKLNSSSSSSPSFYSLVELVGLVNPVPRVPFCVRLTGRDSRGNNLERVSTEMVQPTHVQLQVIIMSNKTRVNLS